MDEKEVGSSPGTLVYTGTMSHEVDGCLYHYREDMLRETPFAGSLPALDAVPDCTAWLVVHGVHDLAMVKQLGARFQLHPLVMEDLVNPVQRMKIEEYDDYLFIVLKWLVRNESGDWETEQLGLILHDQWCVLFLEEASDLLEPLLRRLRKKNSALRKRGPDYLVYAIVDLVVDHYMESVEELSEDLETLEDTLMDPDAAPLDDLKELQNSAQTIKRNLRAMKDLNNAILRVDLPVIQDGTQLYFRDVHDHALQCLDQVESVQESINNALNFYHSMISLRLNEVMKFLTMMGSIFIPLTFIAGIYGMNFQEMPELKWRYGYPAAMALMALVSIGILMYFKRKKWL
ncbi:magnesium/cobalt transporter CorA [Acanthopleuribacter pedis]|uniref:Magnesium transport protein CorA n=1 Tax=Acanthopleuribacter pedis TaxID=442870 RepID=A0A8J7QEE0_9BACT|nr:magnesium/cobalt transporter CorA [Acanthopleuribacter pedis]MBO1322704.1 magnesium/cobalt transporter CorA [Acanthopleuribacter pedis]